MQGIIVDPQNQILLQQHKWFIKSNGYVTAKIDGKFVLLHRLITKAKPSEEIDHINRNKLDNREENLRKVSRSINMHNAEYKIGKSGLIGAQWHKQNRYWVARIRLNGKRIHLGCFQKPEEASRVYQEALRNYLYG